MRLSNKIKPISYLKANAAEIIRNLGDEGEPLIYRIENETVYIYLIVDGRRDMQTLLQRRMLGAL